MTRNDAFNVGINMAGWNPMNIDGAFLHTMSVSMAQSNSLDLNHKNQIMPGFAIPSMLQDEPINELQSDLHMNHFSLVDSDAMVPRDAPFGSEAIRDSSLGNSGPIPNMDGQEQFVDGMLVSSGSLATMLATRHRPHHENLNDLTTTATSAYPAEVLRSFVSNDYGDALNSSFATSINCGYDGTIDDMNSRWDSDKFLAPPELAEKVPGRAGFPFQVMRNMDPSSWISSDNANANSDNPGSSKFCNELSLSLATCQPPVICSATIPDRYSELSCSDVTCHSLCERQLAMEQTSSNGKKISLNFGSKRPVQLPQTFSGSRYLHVIQEILAELASHSLESLNQMNYTTNRTGAGPDISFLSSGRVDSPYSVMSSDDFPDENCRFDDQMDPALGGREADTKKKQLLALLQVVDDRYNKCLDEIHTVISAFHAATELNPHVHARFALQTISFLYKNMRERISNQILMMSAQFHNGGTREEERSFETSFIQKQLALQQLRTKDPQLWRPQRGLPERSVSVLRAWMFQNFLHPYPKDTEKQLLAVKSGLTRSQVSNWFINARVRLWKPMIEEMYTEMNRRKGRRNDEETDSNLRSLINIDNQKFKMN